VVATEKAYALSTEPPKTGTFGPIEAGAVNTAVVRVRRDSVQCLLNNKELLLYKTSFLDLNCDAAHKLRNPKLLGIGCDDPTVIHYARLVEITGKGKEARVTVVALPPDQPKLPPDQPKLPPDQPKLPPDQPKTTAEQSQPAYETSAAHEDGCRHRII